jgi:hypothetical protein
MGNGSEIQRTLRPYSPNEALVPLQTRSPPVVSVLALRWSRPLLRSSAVDHRASVPVLLSTTSKLIGPGDRSHV